MNITAPGCARWVVDTLIDNGHTAVYVGGCVRDSLLRRVPEDWDIATSAMPETLLELFPGCRTEAIRHGTVIVSRDGEQVEVTTFRREGPYSDRRHPDRVSFGCSLEEDLARRDLTVNAMALGPDGGLIDPFGGRSDLAHRLLRCVGEPELRFNEDPLRMMRVVRFSAQLGFEIEEGTLDAVRRCAPLAAGLSAERVRDELMKLLCSSRPGHIWQLVEFGLLDAYLCRDGLRQRHRSLKGLMPSSRLARFCCELEETGCIGSARGFLTALRFPGARVEDVSRAVEVLRSGRSDIKRLLRDYGADAVFIALPQDDRVMQVLRSNECWNLSMLELDGNDLKNLGCSGPEVGAVLERLLEHVIDHPEDNSWELLLRMAESELKHD